VRRLARRFGPLMAATLQQALYHEDIGVSFAAALIP
jgi:hypothetical protein